MSAPPSVPCPEPMPFSDHISGYADIDFAVASPTVYTAQPKFQSVDSVLSNQLGPVTNPVQSVSASPPAPTVGDSNVKPMLSSYGGSDINAPMTLANNNMNFLSVNDILNNPSVTPVPAQPKAPVVQPTNVQPVETAQFTNIPVNNRLPQLNNNKLPIIRKQESFKNLSNTEHFNNPVKNTPRKNLAKFIANKPSVEHFGKPKRIEHFRNMSIMDNIVLAVVIGAFIYYMVTLKNGDSHLDLSKVPIISQLADKNVSMENKIIIVVTIVIACVLINRMLK
jgi:hypothetical protein